MLHLRKAVEGCLFFRFRKRNQRNVEAKTWIKCCSGLVWWVLRGAGIFTMLARPHVSTLDLRPDRKSCRGLQTWIHQIPTVSSSLFGVLSDRCFKMLKGKGSCYTNRQQISWFHWFLPSRRSDVWFSSHLGTQPLRCRAEGRTYPCSSMESPAPGAFRQSCFCFLLIYLVNSSDICIWIVDMSTI